MNTYKRVLSYKTPYWKHLTASVLFTILYALLNGLTVILIIPLLNTLFKVGDQVLPQKPAVNAVVNNSVLNWISKEAGAVIQAIKDFIFTGET